MSTGAIIAIGIAVVLLLVLFAVVMPRLRGAREERKLDRRRGELADRHRDEAQTRAARAELAEREAKRERAEADLHETRAKLHDEGLADEELHGDRDSGRNGSTRGEDPEFERGRRFDRQREGEPERERTR